MVLVVLLWHFDHLVILVCLSRAKCFCPLRTALKDVIFIFKVSFYLFFIGGVVVQDDMAHFHGTYKEVCDKHDPEYYAKFKKVRSERRESVPDIKHALVELSLHGIHSVIIREVKAAVKAVAGFTDDSIPETVLFYMCVYMYITYVSVHGLRLIMFVAFAYFRVYGVSAPVWFNVVGTLQ